MDSFLASLLFWVFFNALFIFMAMLDVRGHPGWAFERAHRLTKRLWLAAGVICLFLPLGGIFYTVAWGVARRAVNPAWKIGDPAAAEAIRQRTAAMKRRRYMMDTLARNEYNAQRPPGSPPAV